MDVIVSDSEIIFDVVCVMAMDFFPGLSIAMLEGRGLELEDAGGTICDGETISDGETTGLELEVAGGTICDGETIGDGEMTSDVVFWVGHDEDPPSRLTGQ